MAILDLQAGAVRHGKVGEHPVVFVHHINFTIPHQYHPHQAVGLILYFRDIEVGRELNFTGLLGGHFRLLDHPGGGTADVEGPQCQLGPRFADGLCGVDAYRIAFAYPAAGGQIGAIAGGT